MCKINHLVSIIVPYFNNQNTLEDTLNSVLHSSYDNIEIIVINDGSEKSPEYLIDKLNDKRIILHSQSNKGVSAARNFGVALSQGEYLLFLDADDLVAPGYIEKGVQILNNNHALKLVCCLTERFDKNKSEKWKLPPLSIENLTASNCIPVSNILRKKDFIAVGGFDENLPALEDWDLWLRLLNSDDDFFQISEYLFYYRQHDISHTNLSKIYFHNKENHNNLLNKIFEKHPKTEVQMLKQKIANFNKRPWYERMIRKIK